MPGHEVTAYVPPTEGRLLRSQAAQLQKVMQDALCAVLAPNSCLLEARCSVQVCMCLALTELKGVSGEPDDLGLVLERSVKLEWHKLTNTRTRCLRITSTEEKRVRKKLSVRLLTHAPYVSQAIRQII